MGVLFWWISWERFRLEASRLMTTIRHGANRLLLGAVGLDVAMHIDRGRTAPIASMLESRRFPAGFVEANTPSIVSIPHDDERRKVIRAGK